MKGIRALFRRSSHPCLSCSLQLISLCCPGLCVQCLAPSGTCSPQPPPAQKFSRVRDLSIKDTEDSEGGSRWKVTIKDKHECVFQPFGEVPVLCQRNLGPFSACCTSSAHKALLERGTLKAQQSHWAPKQTLNAMKAVPESIFYPHKASGQQKIKT